MIAVVHVCVEKVKRHEKVGDSHKLVVESCVCALRYVLYSPIDGIIGV